jgi:hypothetical protein
VISAGAAAAGATGGSVGGAGALAISGDAGGWGAMPGGNEAPGGTTAVMFGPVGITE